MPLLTVKCAALLFGLLLVAGGCQPEVAKAPSAAPPVVLVTSPVTAPVTDYEYFPGRLLPSEMVDVRSRVTGYLDRVLFNDGEVVKAGQVLFEIDPRQYQAEVDRNEAAVAQAQARLERLKKQEDRAKDLLNRKAISQEDFDAAGFDREEAESAVASAHASLDIARLNLSFTKITAKIDGRMSRRLADPGNLVLADDTSLATIVSLDPIYAYFDIDERTLLRLQRMVQTRELPYAWDTQLPVELALADEDGFSAASHKGTLNFTDNQVDATTGSLRARALVKNTDGFLAPGLFVRIRVPVGPEHPALTIPEKALISDQGQRYVYVVDEKNLVDYRLLKVGQSVKGHSVILEGLRADERVIVDGFQRLRRVRREQERGDGSAPRQEVVPKPWKTDTEAIASGDERSEAAATEAEPIKTAISGAGAR